MPSTQPPQNGYYRPTSRADAKRIFVCGAFNHMIETRLVSRNVEDMIIAVNDLCTVFEHSHLGLDERTFTASEAGRRVG